MKRCRFLPYAQLGVQWSQWFLGITILQRDYDNSVWAFSLYFGPLYVDVWRM